MLREDCARLLGRLRESVPLVHQMTNYVTVNDCANATLAIGASPIMADDIGEAADITSISKALVLNIGTLNARTVDSMLAAGKRANECGVPVVLDPVGAGASRLRNVTVERLLREIRVSVIRGNLSELSYIAGLSVQTKGVDSATEDAGKDAKAVAKAVALRHSCTAAITGAVDIISDGARAAAIQNGHPLLCKVTGTGCMTSALVGSFCGAGGDPFVAAAAGVAAMGIAGELAFEAVGTRGTGSFRCRVIDALSRLDGPVLLERGRIHEA